MPLLIVRRMTIVVIAVVTSALLLNVLEVLSTVAYVDESETDTDQEIREENICRGFAVSYRRRPFSVDKRSSSLLV